MNNLHIELSKEAKKANIQINVLLSNGFVYEAYEYNFVFRFLKLKV